MRMPLFLFYTQGWMDSTSSEVAHKMHTRSQNRAFSPQWLDEDGTKIWKCQIDFLEDFIYFQRERQGERKRGRETPVGSLLHAPTRNLAHNRGTCLNWESNW